MAEKIGKSELKDVILGCMEELRDAGQIPGITDKDAITKEMTDNLTQIIEKRFGELEGKKHLGSDKMEDDRIWKSTSEFLGAVTKAGITGEMDARFKAADGANESVASEGGFLVTPEWSKELITIAHDTGMLYKKCRKIPVSGNSLTLNGIDEQSRANGSRWGGITIYWSDEAGTVTATKPKVRQMNLKLKKLMGLCYATQELLDDQTALQSVLTQGFGEEFGYKLDDGILNGTGAGQLLGILNSPAFVTQAIESAQTLSHAFIYENVVNMWNRMLPRNRMNAEWYINQDLEPWIDRMSLIAGTAGIPVNPAVNGLINASQPTLKNRPIVPLEQCQAVGTTGDVILADFSQYLVIDKGGMGMQTASSIHVKFVYDEMTYRFTYRVDGQPLWHSTLTAANSGTTRSPFVGLGTRTA